MYRDQNFIGFESPPHRHFGEFQVIQEEFSWSFLSIRGGTNGKGNGDNSFGRRITFVAAYRRTVKGEMSPSLHVCDSEELCSVSKSVKWISGTSVNSASGMLWLRACIQSTVAPSATWCETAVSIISAKASILILIKLSCINYKFGWYDDGWNGLYAYLLWLFNPPVHIFSKISTKNIFLNLPHISKLLPDQNHKAYFVAEDAKRYTKVYFWWMAPSGTPWQQYKF